MREISTNGENVLFQSLIHYSLTGKHIRGFDSQEMQDLINL